MKKRLQTMKYFSKLLVFGLALTLTFSLTSCSNQTVEANAPVSTPAATEPTAAGTQTDGPAILDVTIPSLGTPVTTAESSSTAESSEETSPETSVPPSDMDLSKVIALTFDDGPNTSGTDPTNRILNVLEQYNVKATFFVQAIAIKEWFPNSGSAAVKRAADLGCEIGTHTYSHCDLNKASAETISSEITKSCQIIEEASGQKVQLFRPPYGNAKDSVKSQVDMPIILWDVDTQDWKSKDADAIVKVTMDNIRGGSIVLMHDIYGSTADAVEILVPKLLDEGYTLVTVSELFELYGRSLENHKSYGSAR